MFKTINSLVRILNHPFNKGKLINTLGRVFWWKFNQNFIKLPTIVGIVNGVKCICYPDSSYGGLVVYKGLPEYEEMTYISSNLKNGDIFIDIGANIGAVSLIAASKVGPKGRVFAFEPNKKVLPRLFENVSLNNMDKTIQISNTAISNNVSQVAFVNEKASEVSHISYSKPMGKSGDLVKTTTLDKFFDDQKLSKVKMVKIDVEGAELSVLEGCILSFNKIEMMLIEINKNSEKYGNSTKETFNFIVNQGFKIYRFSNEGNLTKIGSLPEEEKVINVLATKKHIHSK